MGRTAAAGIGSLGRALARTGRYTIGLPSSLSAVLILAGLTQSFPCRAQDLVRQNLVKQDLVKQDLVKGEATFTASGGYARLVLKLAEDVESEVTTAGSIIVIRFKRPVDIPVDKLSDAVPDYVGSARRDPDGSAIRLSLQRRATVNTMTAGERIFVDFLPDSWTGPPPSLPAEVIRELSERARVAERALRLQRAAADSKKKPPVRVRASVQPTFVRFVFEMPDGVAVSSVLNDQKLTLLFNSVLAFDLADAKVAAPPNVASIKQRVDVDSSAVDITLIGEVDVHSFREEKNYIIDIAFQQAEKPILAETPAAAAPAVAHAPAKPVAMVPAARDRPVKETMPPQQPAQVAPVTSETFADEAKIEIKPEQAAKAPPAADKAAPTAEKTARAAENAAPEKAAPQEAPKAEKQSAASEAPKSAPAAQEPPAHAT